jgi:hypothetical protein
MREAITVAYSRRRHEIPIPTELQWHADRPQFTIRSPLLSLFVRFSREAMQVDAELSLAAKALATTILRRNAIRIIDSIAADLGL